MMQFSDSRPRSVISSDLKIDGNLVTTGELEVSGKIKGEIGAASMVLHPTADIEGQISAGDLVTNGMLKGTASAIKITIGSAAVVEGEMTCEIIEISAGARIDGRINHVPGERAQPEPQAEQSAEA
ncbi:MAG: polymer-forming cytoskeletal protein [Rhodobacteraceae bacterium]|nr:polymer-forming cytoskeletal protein [Paracoccaceae bacterium]